MSWRIMRWWVGRAKARRQVMQEAESGRRRSLNAGNAKDVALRKDSINDPSENPFPAAIAEREAHIRACQACRDTPRLGIDEDDLRQNLLLEAVKAWPRYDPSIASPRTYLSGVMRKQALAEKRRAFALHKREAQINAHLAATFAERELKASVSEGVATDELVVADLRRAALEAIPEERREAASLMLAGLTDIEIGKRLGLHRGTVHRMHARFQRMWRATFPDLARDISGSARRERRDALSPGGTP